MQHSVGRNLQKDETQYYAFAWTLGSGSAGFVIQCTLRERNAGEPCAEAPEVLGKC